MDGKQTTITLNHNIARFSFGIGNQSNPPIALFLHPLTDGFSTSSGFAKASSGHDQPYLPISLRRQLIRSRNLKPVEFCGNFGAPLKLSPSSSSHQFNQFFSGK